jgi:hypothetical protein
MRACGTWPLTPSLAEQPHDGSKSLKAPEAPSLHARDHLGPQIITPFARLQVRPIQF